VPWSLKRYQHSGDTHFLTFSCYQRQPFFGTDKSRRTFEEALERVRRTYRLCVPEHVHILVSEPERATLADALKSLKQGVARDSSIPLPDTSGRSAISISMFGATAPVALPHRSVKSPCTAEFSLTASLHSRNKLREYEGFAPPNLLS
jgi:hypothetical protein